MTEEDMVSTHEKLMNEWQTYLEEHSKFENKNVKAAAARARKALGAIAKLSKVRRAEIQETKQAMSRNSE